MGDVTTEQKIREWRKEQKRRCSMWIRGQQCHHYHMSHSRYCALHGKGTQG